MDGRVEARALAVDCDLCERAHRAGKAAPFTVHRDHEPHAGTSVVLSETDAGGKQGIGDVELTEVEEAVLDVVDPDGQEVQRIDGRDLQNTERRDCIGGVELCGEFRNAVHLLRLSHRDACRGNAECRRDELGHHGRECAAADKHDRLRRLAVEF